MFGTRKKSRKGIEQVKEGLNDHYIIANTILGEGTYGTVRKGLHKASNTPVAIKILDKKSLSKANLKNCLKEAEILKKLKHKNVVKYHDFYDEEERFVLVMEYIPGGELLHKITSEEAMSESEARNYIKTIAEALFYCKTKGVVHRDIKPGNILLTKSGDIKLVDFNLSANMDPEQMSFSILETICGTPNYVAPEVLLGKPYNYKCDLWSLGVMAYVLLSGGYLPFGRNKDTKDRANTELINRVKRAQWGFNPAEAWSHISAEGKDVVSNLLKKNPKQRFGYEQLLNHSWFHKQEMSLAKAVDLKNLFASVRIKKEFNNKSVEKAEASGAFLDELEFNC